MALAIEAVRKAIRVILRRDGRRMIGRWRSALLYGKTWGKSLLWTLAVSLHQEHRIIQRRSIALSEDEMQEATEIVAQVLRTPLPGKYQPKST